MQAVAIDVGFLSLLAFLFATVSWSRRDDRLWCWAFGWLCVIGYFAVQLAEPKSSLWQAVEACADVNTLAFAGVLFVISTMVLSEGRRKGLQLGVMIALPTAGCLSLAAIGFRNVPLFVAAIVARQALAIFMALRPRPNRPMLAAIAPLLCATTGAFSVYGVLHGQPGIVSVALLAEIFLVASLDFWHNQWRRTLGLYTIASGLVVWGLAFPLAYWFRQNWPQLLIDDDIWTIPKLCVAVGMIMVVIEEDGRAKRALNEEYRMLFENGPHPLWILETETMQFVDVNRAALEMHGYTRDEFLRLKLPDLLHPEAVPFAKQNVLSSVAIPTRASRHVRKDGSVFPVDVTAHTIIFRGKECRFILAVDVTERQRLEEQLVHQAQHDALTGIANRMRFEEKLGQAVSRAIEREEKLGILCIDIRRFKRINDLYGPRIGNECIMHVARILAAHLGATDILARTGGDEFTIVLDGIRNPAEAEQRVAELRAPLSEPLRIEGYQLQLSFSMGLAICPDDGTNAATLWRSAEGVLRRAQTAGAQETVWQSPELRKEAEDQIEIEASMRMDLKDGGFYLVYQPLYDFNGRLRGLETLLRLMHPRLGAVSPAKVIPIAEETGLIVPLGDWVIEQVCRQLRSWAKDGMCIVPVAINVSTLQLIHVDFAERLMQTLDRYEIAPSWIHLEVTETAAMSNLDEVSVQIAELSGRGISFSIDDFGTGHSSLGRLHQLAFSELKIDRSFTEQLCRDKQSTLTIVQAIISMAHALGKTVVAEGVETETQLACLRELECDRIQGFLISRPVDPGEIPALMTMVHAVFKSVTSISDRVVA